MSHPPFVRCLSTGFKDIPLALIFAVLATANTILAAEPSAPVETTAPVEPRDALGLFSLPPELRIELVACEPEVVDPVAARFDEDGRLWVAEMRDYPLGPPPGEPPMSRIKLLEDRDGDGRFETARLFADRLSFVTGLQPWRGGVIVTLAGEVAYMKDNDGDGRADLRETWFRGFATENSQLRANHPRFALDNTVYIANGLRGGTVSDARNPQAPPLSISSRDFHFDPAGKFMEAVSGVGQFGLTFDAFGRRFVCSNRNPLKHVVLEDRYLARNPLVATAEVAQDVAAAAEKSRVYALVSAWTTSNLHAGQFTAACGVEVFGGDALPAEFRGAGFTCEPTGSLVHCEIMKPLGASFASQPFAEGREFLASRDPWFRPVNLTTGPDGALYVVDMYRAVIEHPDFVPVELKNRPDQRLGDDRGRIYRIVARDKKHSPSAQPQLSAAKTADLVPLLDRENMWWRETAARIIYERQDKSIEAPLAKLAKTGQTPAGRAQALWSLRGLGLDGGAFEAALPDASPRVQEQAVVLCETRLASQPELLSKIMALAASDDARLRFQVVLTCAFADEKYDARETLLSIGLSGADDLWTRRAANIAARERAGEIAARMTAKLRPVDWSPGRLQLLVDLAESCGAQKSWPLAKPLFSALGDGDSAHVARPSSQFPLVRGFAQGLNRRGMSLTAFLKDAPIGDHDPRQKLAAVFATALKVVADREQPEAARLEAIDVVKHADYATAGETLLAIANDSQSEALQIRAILALAPQRESQIGAALLPELASRAPAVRRAILDVVLADAARTKLLLDEMEAGRMRASELDTPRKNKLLNHRDQAVRERANRLFAQLVSPDRQKVLQTYLDCLTLPADPLRGKEVFRVRCSACHRVGELGVDVGPDISDSRTKTPLQLLTDIIQPNRAIDSNFIGHTLITHDGQVLTGVIATETGGSITLKQPEGKTVTLLRTDIETLRSSGLSLMPEGLEGNIPQPEMADLVSFIKNWRYMKAESKAK